MIKRKVLNNGMTVVFKPRENKVVSVAFAVRYGGGNEKAQDKGIAHFIEHMLYKGTEEMNSKEISTEIEKKGGELNGFTSEQVTAFWCKIPSKHIDVALKVLGEMVKNPKFEKEDIEKERKVIFEEMKMYKDNPQLHVFEKFKSCLYKGDFSLPIIGSEESMKNNSQEKLKSFFSKIYCPKNMILVVVGEADFEKICDFAEDFFQEKNFEELDKPIIERINKEEIEKREGVDQANLILGYHSPLPSDKKIYAAHLLSVLMGGGMSSRLFHEIREKRNLAYAIKAFLEGEKDFAYSGIYVGTMKENVEEVKNLILDEFEKVGRDLKEEELEQIKDQVIGNYLISQEDSHNLLFNVLFAEIKGNVQEVEEFTEKIREVKLGDVKELAKNVKENYSFFALIPK
jgi:predicted Zn-dependent peptidase